MAGAELSKGITTGTAREDPGKLFHQNSVMKHVKRCGKDHPVDGRGRKDKKMMPTAGCCQHGAESLPERLLISAGCEKGTKNLLLSPARRIGSDAFHRHFFPAEPVTHTGFFPDTGLEVPQDEGF